ncbi:alpha/beta fold hydrolase [Paenibacillus sp. GCM10012306]|uniref:alpha/beta fold hydrolase n=1 Tax=Paenibacillus sp. GCM10012306 TaxID=3317342 RepID=UPI00361E68DA
MRKVKRILLYLGLAILLLVGIGLIFPTWTPAIKGENSISELKQVEINGTGHELMIRGQDKSNPVVIFVHGGPGVSEIPYVTKYQDELEKHFTIVHYDQRATGKSYHFGEDYSNLTSDLLVKDLLVLTDYISDRLDKKKVILMGHSFGTYIATQAVQQAPEKYEAYIGIGQMADTVESELDALNYMIDQAKSSGNTTDVQHLQGLTDKIQSGEQLAPRDYLRKYGGAARLIDEATDIRDGFLFGPEYNLLDIIRFYRGLFYSQDTLLKPAMDKPLPSLVTKLNLPVYFIMGKYDYMTSADSAHKYMEKLEAPQKELIIYDQSAHYPQFEEKAKFSQWMTDTFAK